MRHILLFGLISKIVAALSHSFEPFIMLYVIKSLLAQISTMLFHSSEKTTHSLLSLSHKPDIATHSILQLEFTHFFETMESKRYEKMQNVYHNTVSVKYLIVHPTYIFFLVLSNFVLNRNLAVSILFLPSGLFTISAKFVIISLYTLPLVRRNIPYRRSRVSFGR